MARPSITASERRGILVVAALALIMTGGGFLLSRCSGDNTPPPPPEITVVSTPDSLSPDRRKHSADTISHKKRKRSQKSREKKTYRTRSPLDEPV